MFIPPDSITLAYRIEIRIGRQPEKALTRQVYADNGLLSGWPPIAFTVSTLLVICFQIYVIPVDILWSMSGYCFRTDTNMRRVLLWIETIWYDMINGHYVENQTVTLEINWIYNHNDRYLTRATTHKHIYNAIITLHSIDKTAQQPNYSRLRAICVRFEWIEQNTIPTMSHHLLHLNVRMTKTKTKKTPINPIVFQ